MRAMSLRLYVLVQLSILLAFLVLGLLTSACSSTLAPTPLSPMEAWAQAHASESCLLVTQYDPRSGQYVNHGMLVATTELAYYGGQVHVMPISYCNPAE